MYILQNAWKSISRNLTRNILICLITLIIAVSVCVALSIRQASEATKEDTLASLSVTAQISYDRAKAMEEMQASMSTDSSEGAAGRSFDFEALQGQALTLDDYLDYAQALTDADWYYYAEAISLNGSDITPYGESTEEPEDATTQTNAPEGFMPMDEGGMGGGGLITQGDFNLTGYSSYDALMSLFGSEGTYSVTQGEMFDASSADMNCVISNELALQNDLSVGDTIVLANPNAETETYTLEVSGIYTDTSSGAQDGMRRFFDPANNIYASSGTVAKVLEASEQAANVMQNEDGTEEAANIEATVSFTYAFASAENFYYFEEQVYKLGLSEEYLVTSSDLSAFESSLVPLESLSTMAGWFLAIILAVGGAILVGLSILNLRERKYEIGVLTAIGMKKGKVVTQYVIEAFIVTSIGIVLGAVIGASLSIPVTNELLASQIENNQTANSELAGNFGLVGDGQQPPTATGGVATIQRGGEVTVLTGQPGGSQINYVDSVSSATDLFVIVQLLGIGLLLTFISSLAALVTIMRYDPLRILSSRS